jgi:RimJ/RimL family protein N-acetyltransferase
LPEGHDRAIGHAGPWFPPAGPSARSAGPSGTLAAEGQGFAFEAARATVAHAFRDLGWDTAVSYIDPDNARSIALAERLGARPDPDARPNEPGLLVYRHPRPENPA